MIIKSEKQKIIYEAAARLFRDKEYRATSVRDLAKAVGLKASSLYNHIGSKEEILRQICFENAQRFLEGMESIQQKEIPADEKVKALILLHIKMAEEDLTSVTSFNDEWRHLSEPHLSEFIHLRKKYELQFKSIIEEGIQSGLFNPINTTIALHTILSSVRWVFDWYYPGRKISIDELGRQIAALVIGGLKRNE